MSEHTPGPWEADGVGSDGSFEIWSGVISGKEGAFIICSRNPIEHRAAASRANARLIAAAPDLLEALQGVLRVADRRTVEFDAAHAAIKKATVTS